MTPPPPASTTPGEHRRVVVSGGAGFIGSHLTELLLARGDHVTVVDNLSTGRRSNLPAMHERLRFVEADLKDALAAFGKGETFDEIYHLAAAVGVKLIIADPIRSIETNIEQTSALLRFAATRSREGRGVPTLIASSSEVYGKSTRSPFSEEDDVVYGPTTMSRWSYACTKAVDEYLALAYHAQQGLPAVVTRFFNTVGPRQVGEYGMVLPRFVQAALEGRDLEVYGDGTQSRCFCDVRDVVEVLPRLMANPACHGQVFNVGADTPITIGELASSVITTLRSTSGVRKIPYTQAYTRGFEDLGQRRPDLSRLRAAVGFAPRIPLERTILDVAASFSTDFKRGKQ
ncbi:MAG TPA: NAD-dependent epimerase/dehydratase family protein [Phycisphaerales bacterium]|nr:NAD-dependent epimerase/dehydratase family protein [Phycisphaerales bacterium]